MDEKKYVPFSSMEGAVASYERINRRLWILCIILILALLGTNAGWLFHESQFEDVVVTQEIDANADGDSDLNLNAIGGDYNVSESNSETDD